MIEINFLKKRSTVNFLSSFGVMVLGVGLLFFGSVYFGSNMANSPKQFPASKPRLLSQEIGGDKVTEFPASKPRVPVSKNGAEFSEALTARAALVVDDETNAVLYEKNSNTPRPLASITKLMSALVLNSLPLNWQRTSTVISDDVDSSSHQLVVGDVLSLDDLWHVALIGSSNSAVEVLVRQTGLGVDGFAALMNKRALELRAPSLFFVEPTGLDANDVGSAWDIARLLKEALKIPRIEQTLSIGEYYIRPQGADKSRRVWSTDWLLNDWVSNDFGSDQIVGKTGYIGESGYNFAARFTGKNNHSVRVVILGADSNEARFSEARDLAAWALKDYIWPSDVNYASFVE